MADSPQPTQGNASNPSAPPPPAGAPAPTTGAPAAPAGAASPAPAAGAAAIQSAKEKAGAAVASARTAAKAGLKVFQKAGLGAATQFKGVLFSVLSFPLLIFRGDWSTRVLMLGFISSILLVGVTVVQLWERFIPRNPAVPLGKTEMGQGMSKFLQEQKELAIATASVVFLERFSATLTSQSGKVQVFEIEVYIETDGPETSAVIKSHLDGVHEIVGGAIQGQKYEILMTDDGKAEFKKKIAQAITKGLKKWGSDGSIRRVFFTQFKMG